MGGGLITTGNAENNATISVKEDEVDTTTSAAIMYNKDSWTDKNAVVNWCVDVKPCSAMMDSKRFRYGTSRKKK
jgi:hypothetical protein